MDGIKTFFIVGIAVFSIIAAMPVALPLIENLVTSMQFMPRGY